MGKRAVTSESSIDVRGDVFVLLKERSLRRHVTARDDECGGWR